MSSSAAGAAVTTKVASLQTTLADDLGVTGFTSVPSLPSVTLTRDEFLS